MTNRGDVIGVLELFLPRVTLVGAVTGAYGGEPPKDDATVLCLDRHGPPHLGAARSPQHDGVG
ncbi:hypothetical protein ACODT3_04745 [Streptomyces sp. 4.24]|uniref:hypothetical protein n=1 Tax=Streptomyces tritrimontium TaxID=3406573 RepID=UPI003BB4C00E